MQITVKEKKIEDGRFGSFFPGPAALLLSPFAKILSGFLVVSLLSCLGFSFYKVLQVKDLKIELVESQMINERLTSDLSECIVEIKQTNDKIADIVADAKADTDELVVLNEELSRITTIQNEQIAELVKRPPPQNCAESMGWLRSNTNIFEKSE